MNDPLIALQGVGLTYPGPPPIAALQPCDQVVGRGEKVMIMGASGSGKSKKLNLLGVL